LFFLIIKRNNCTYKLKDIKLELITMLIPMLICFSQGWGWKVWNFVGVVILTCKFRKRTCKFLLIITRVLTPFWKVSDNKSGLGLKSLKIRRGCNFDLQISGVDLQILANYNECFDTSLESFWQQVSSGKNTSKIRGGWNFGLQI